MSASIDSDVIAQFKQQLEDHPVYAAVSSLEELSAGRFQRLLPDRGIDPARARRVLLCSGKVYYDLLAQREARARDDVAIVRIEQLYPLEPGELSSALEPYAPGTDVVWVQEEPENMGAWAHLALKFGDRIRQRGPLHRVSRPESASAATGSAASHKLEQQTLLDAAFAPFG